MEPSLCTISIGEALGDAGHDTKPEGSDVFIYIYIFMYCNPLVKKVEEDHVAHEPAQSCLSVCLCCQCILKIVHFPFHFSSISK